MRRIGLTVFCTLAILGGTGISAEAGLIPWAYNAIFGTGPYYGGAAYGPTYANYGYAPMASTWSANYVSYGYSPAVSYASYAPLGYGAAACCPTTCCPSPCAPCGIACGPGGCPGGNCGITYDAAPAAGTITPQPDGAAGPPPTYLEQQPMGTNPATPPTDNGFRRRDAQQEQQEDVFGQDQAGGAFGSNSSGRTDAFLGPESIIEQRKPAPSDLPAEEASGPSIQGENLKLVPLGLDDKITWRTPPQRTRLAVEANYATPVVARTKLNPNSDWTPVSSETRLAKK